MFQRSASQTFYCCDTLEKDIHRNDTPTSVYQGFIKFLQILVILFIEIKVHVKNYIELYMITEYEK